MDTKVPADQPSIPSSWHSQTPEAISVLRQTLTETLELEKAQERCLRLLLRQHAPAHLLQHHSEALRFNLQMQLRLCHTLLWQIPCKDPLEMRLLAAHSLVVQRHLCSQDWAN